MKNLPRMPINHVTLPDFKVCYKTTVTKPAWDWVNNRYIDQWSTLGSLEINPHICGQLLFYKGARKIQWGKDSVFS